jgi:hypothetical protein
MSKLSMRRPPEPVNEHIAWLARVGLSQVMTDHDLLLLYRATRQAIITTCSFDSSASVDERRAAFLEHSATLALIETRFPGISFVHSTAEWHLQQAIDETLPDQPAVR